jgi:hypothetical protein
MLIAIFLTTFVAKFHLKPTCNFEENPIQTRDIIDSEYHLVPFKKQLAFAPGCTGEK